MIVVSGCGEGNGHRFIAKLALTFLAAVSGFSEFNAAPADSRLEPRSPFVLAWKSDPNDSRKVRIEVGGVSMQALAGIFEPPWTQEERARLLSVRIRQISPVGTTEALPMAGRLEVAGGLLVFLPAFPFEPGSTYEAHFQPSLLPGVDASSNATIPGVFTLPREMHAPTAQVSAVYPSSKILPENLLKFYLHFSAPMSRGHIYDHIRLKDEQDKVVELPFLEIDEELWNPDLTRLTLFIDPGRIKRGVKPLEEIGPSLEQGKSYVLEIDREWVDALGTPMKSSFRKKFSVGAPDRSPIRIDNWKVTPPRAGTRQPLRVDFGKPMDHALANRCLSVKRAQGGVLLQGESELEDEERIWRFTPKQNWDAGAHEISIVTTLEDLAGNNIGKAFEVDLIEPIEKKRVNPVVVLAFQVQ